MSGRLSLQNRQSARPVHLRPLRRILRTLLVELLELREFDLGVCLLPASTMTGLNGAYLRHNGSTDVITFDYAVRAGAGLNGEILICVEEAIAQARHYHTRWESELIRYAVHGVLHLLGHDDRHIPARRRMKREEDRLLGLLSRRFDFRGIACATARPQSASETRSQPGRGAKRSSGAR